MCKIINILFSLKGSINRKELWVYSTIIMLLFFFVCITMFSLLTKYLMNSQDTAAFDIFVYYKYLIIVFLPLSFLLNWIFLALGVKRSHDLCEKGISVFIAFLISMLLLITSFIQFNYVYGPQIGFTNTSLPPFVLPYLNYFIYTTSIVEFILFIYLSIHLGFKKGQV